MKWHLRQLFACKQLNINGLLFGRGGPPIAPSEAMEFKRILVAVNSPNGRDAAFERSLVDADLIVVGRSRGFKLLGSTALRVLRKNHRTLLVIPSAAHRTSQIEWQRAA